jgi:1,4-alpha-glucan branching enzyme
LEAVSFLKEFNEMTHRDHPDVVTIAEESTAWPSVSRPVSDGGLGFDQKWMMGWMHDTLKYVQLDPLYRKDHHHELTFSLIYAFSENFMLPLSHDEVVHGKGPLFDKMPGDEWMKFAGLRALYGYMWTHPGTQLLFMGGEFGQTSEWSIERGLVWELLNYDGHQGVQAWVRDLNHFYAGSKALYEQQFTQFGFEWIEHADWQNSIIIYMRRGVKAEDLVLVVCNFTPVAREGYCFGAPQSGNWEEVLNSDDKKYGGKGILNSKPIKAKKEEKHGRKFSLEVSVPPLGVVIFAPQKTKAKK